MIFSNNKKEMMFAAMIALAFICSCAYASAGARCSTCEQYDPNAGNYYCGMARYTLEQLKAG